MKIPQTKLREVILQALYAYEIEKEGGEPLQSLLMDSVEISRKNTALAEEKAKAILAKKEELEAKIAFVSQGYQLERISLVDRAVLRMALYELFFENLPVAIVIDEAIRLSRKFSTPNASRFVQAVVDAIAKGTVCETVLAEEDFSSIPALLAEETASVPACAL